MTKSKYYTSSMTMHELCINMYVCDYKNTYY